MSEDNGASASQTGLSSLRDEAGKPSSPKASIPSAVWLIWASEGEYSDRSEWPIVAVHDEATAEWLVVHLTQLWRSASEKWRHIEPEWYNQEAVDAFWRDDADAAEYARFTGATGGLGGGYADERSFTCCQIELLAAQAIETRSDATGTGAAVGESAVPTGGAQ